MIISMIQYLPMSSYWHYRKTKRDVYKRQTIGSVKNHPELFTHFKNIIVDECHLVNPKEGMHKDFFDAVKCKDLGLTATPYRLSSSRDFGSMLNFITRTKPHVFSEVIYHVQVSTLLDVYKRQEYGSIERTETAAVGLR